MDKEYFDIYFQLNLTKLTPKEQKFVMYDMKRWMVDLRRPLTDAQRSWVQSMIKRSRN